MKIAMGQILRWELLQLCQLELSERILLTCTYSRLLIFRLIPFCVKVYILHDFSFSTEVRVDFIPLLY